MKIVVFGAAGQVASALAARVKDAVDEWRFVARSEAGGEFLKLEELSAFLEREMPDVIVNAAAITGVDFAQTAPEAAMTVNAEAPAVLARFAAQKGVYLIHLSSDYVFDGSGTEAKTETDAVSPLNVYGQTKAAAENAVAQSGCKAAVLRLTWVYDACHSNFVTETVKRLLSGQTVTAFEDQTGSPTAAADVACVILKLVQEHRKGKTLTGLYHFADTGYCSRLECAQFIKNYLADRASGVVLPIKVAALQLPAKRPLNCRLNTQKILKALNFTPRSWQEALVETVNDVLGSE